MTTKLKLFGKSVIISQRKKDTIQLHLPEGAKSGALFDLVVANVGDDVTRVKVGDVVMAHCPPGCAQVDPTTDEAVMVIQEDMIQGVIVEESMGVVTETEPESAVHRVPEGKFFPERG